MIQRLDQTPKYLKALVYGEPGAGKTYLAATAPNPLFVDVEGGTMTIRNRQIPVAKAECWADVEEILDHLQAGTKGWTGFETLVIDSISEVQYLCNEALLIENFARKPDTLDPDVLDQQGWGKSFVRMNRILRRFRNLPMHVVMTALVDVVKDDITKKVSYRPLVQGKFGVILPGIMDVLGYLYTETDPEDDNELVRMLLVQPMGKYIARERIGTLGTVVQKPTIPYIINELKKKQEREEA